MTSTVAPIVERFLTVQSTRSLANSSLPALKTLRLGTARFSIILEEYTAESQLSVKLEQRTGIVRAEVR